MNTRLDLSFIQRCMEPEFQVEVQALNREYILNCNKWARENPKLQYGCAKKYEKTEKGRIARRKVYELRQRRIRMQSKDLTRQEKIRIQEFYINCPKGYEVDHIIPISKGGLHKICNLQYLTKNENRRKSAKLNWNEKIKENYKIISEQRKLQDDINILN